MSEWLDYMTKLMEEGEVQRACVAVIDCKRWIASDRSILLSLKEVELLYRRLTEKSKTPLKFKDKMYNIEQNDGFIMQCASTVGSSKEYMYVGKTRQFIIVATTQSLKAKETCHIEVDWMRNHIREQGM